MCQASQWYLTIFQLGFQSLRNLLHVSWTMTNTASAWAGSNLGLTPAWGGPRPKPIGVWRLAVQVSANQGINLHITNGASKLWNGPQMQLKKEDMPKLNMWRKGHRELLLVGKTNLTFIPVLWLTDKSLFGFPSLVDLRGLTLYLLGASPGFCSSLTLSYGLMTRAHIRVFCTRGSPSWNPLWHQLPGR